MTRRLKLGLLALAAMAISTLAACGDAGDTSGGGERTVTIRMVDIAFEPDSVDVDAGETVRFVLRNEGALDHDAFVGDRAAQAEHEREMAKGETGDSAEPDDHGADHSGDGASDEAGGITVRPGKQGTLTHTFDDAGTLEVGCHQPGHYDAGMRIIVRVR